MVESVDYGEGEHVSQDDGAPATDANPYATKGFPLATEFNPYATGKDYSKIPQRLHEYPSSDRAQKMVHDPVAIDTLPTAKSCG